MSIELKSLDLSYPKNWTNFKSFNGEFLIIASNNDYSCIIFDVINNNILVEINKIPIQCLHIALSKKHLIIANKNAICVWDFNLIKSNLNQQTRIIKLSHIPSGTFSINPDNIYGADIDDMVLSPNGKWLVIATKSKKITVWECHVAYPKLYRIICDKLSNYNIGRLTFSHDCNILLNNTNYITDLWNICDQHETTYNLIIPCLKNGKYRMSISCDSKIIVIFNSYNLYINSVDNFNSYINSYINSVDNFNFVREPIKVNNLHRIVDCLFSPTNPWLLATLCKSYYEKTHYIILYNAYLKSYIASINIFIRFIHTSLPLLWTNDGSRVLTYYNSKIKIIEIPQNLHGSLPKLLMLSLIGNRYRKEGKPRLPSEILQFIYEEYYGILL